MSKNKTWIKSLLIIVMALIMVFTLVACNDDKDDDNNNNNDVTTGQTAEYFSNLWKLTSKLGSEKLNAEDTIAVDLGLELAIRGRRVSSPYDVIQQIDLGVELQAVVGRTDATSKDTALKIKLYDPTDAQHSEIVALYLFANDLENLYVDFGGHSIRVPNTVAYTIWNDALGHEDTDKLGDNIAKGINNKFITLKGKEEKQSINDILQSFVGEFGSTWNLNTLINGLVKLFNVDLNSLIGDLAKNQIFGGILGIKSVDDIKDANGNVDLMKVLSGNTIGKLFTIVDKKVGDTTVHKAMIEDSSLGLVLDIIKMAPLFGSKATTGEYPSRELSLVFTEQNQEIKDFSILARLGGCRSNVTGANGGKYVIVPEVEVKINKLRIEKADDDNKIEFNESEYSEDIAINEKLSVKLDGFKYGTTEFNNVTFEIGVAGKLDIVNETNNKTQLNITVKEIKSTGTTVLAQASYNEGVIVASLNEAISFGGTNYKGVKVDVSDKINIAKSIKDGIKKIVSDIQNKGNGGASAAADETLATNLQKVISVILPLVITDNDLTLDANNILDRIVKPNDVLGLVCYIVNTFDKNSKWTNGNRIEAIVNAFTNPPLGDKGLGDTARYLLAEFGIELNGTDVTYTNKDINWKNVGNGVLQALYNFAQDISIEGVVAKTTDYTKAEIQAIVGVKTKQVNNKPVNMTADEQISDEMLALWNNNKAFIANIIAVLGTKDLVINGNVQGGVHASIVAKIGEATLTIEESLEVTDEFQFVDVNDVYTKDVQDGNGDLWVVYPAQQEA